jgi:hypothetical protein
MANREFNDAFTEFTEIPHSWPAAFAATDTVPLRKIQRDMRVYAVDLVVDTTYAADPTNFYVITLQKGATVIATWSTQTGQQGTLTADTIVQMVLSATDTARVCNVGDVFQLVFTKVAAAANLPIGRSCAHCLYV